MITRRDPYMQRYQMHAQIYAHKTNCACNAMLECIRERLQVVGWGWYNKCGTIEDFLEIFSGLDDRAFVNKLLDPLLDHESRRISEVAKELFVERKLVKRVFEGRFNESVSDMPHAEATKERCSEHKRRLDQAGIWVAEDVFKNKGPKINTANYPLKIVRKHPADGWYLVEELRTHSVVARFLPETECTLRLYCNESDVKKAKQLLPH